MIDIDAILGRLSDQRPIFHSEADFQFAFAWQLQEEAATAQVRLEFKPFAAERVYLDIWLAGFELAIELKYRTRSLSIEWNEESYHLRDQAAQDVSRYDFFRDVQRLEDVCARDRAASGLAILLTNDPTYWRQSPHCNTVDTAFRVHDGRHVTGPLAWSDHASLGTTKGRERAITLQGNYNLRWQDYSRLGDGPNRRLRYLAVPVWPGGTDVARSFL